MLRHPDMFEQVVREQRADVRFQVERDRLTRRAEGTRPAPGWGLGRFLGRVRERLVAPHGSEVALPRTAHPSRA